MWYERLLGYPQFRGQKTKHFSTGTWKPVARVILRPDGIEVIECNNEEGFDDESEQV